MMQHDILVLREGHMRVYNKTRFDDNMIKNIMRAAKVTSTGPVTALHIWHVSDLDCSGICEYLSNGEVIVKVRCESINSLSTLAHELKHVAQLSHDMGDWMDAACETDKHSERWHEIEAIEFSKRYA
jgi:hypothetical protein